VDAALQFHFGLKQAATGAVAPCHAQDPRAWIGCNGYKESRLIHRPPRRKLASRLVILARN